MKYCPNCNQNNADSYNECINCMSNISDVKSTGPTTKLPSTKEILKRATHKDKGDGRYQFIGLACSGLALLLLIGIMIKRKEVLTSLYDMGPLVIVAYFVGKSLSKKMML
jgi:uncharacterized membrane protein YvbJ